MTGPSLRRRLRLRSAAPPTLPRGTWAVAFWLLLGVAGAAMAADPQRGALLFATPPAPGLLACADCHGADPQVNNFGNIWAARNAVSLIQRAVQANTGGMGYFGSLYSGEDFADIAATLGNTPAALSFESTEVGQGSGPRSVIVATSTKVGLGALRLRTEGDFGIAGSTCGTSVPRFSTCAVDVVFRPAAAGQRSGSLLIEHDGTPTPVRIALAGPATARPAAIARLEPARLDFAAAGPPGVQSAAVLNDSAERLTLGSIASSTAAFRVIGGSCRPGFELLPGRRCEVALRFDPPGSGVAGAPLTTISTATSTSTSTATLTIVHDGVGGRSTLALSGRVDGDGEGATPAWLQADVPVVDFGSLAAGARAAVQTVTWRHAGTADWRWFSTTVSAPGVHVLADGCRSAGRVAPGQACTVVLSFDPQRPGGSSGRLVLQGSGGEPAAMVPVSGLATAGPAVLVATPARLSVGGPVGHSVRRQLQLVAQGDASLALASITLAGADAARFALPAGGGCAVGTLLTPATGCTLTLDFTAGRAGLHQAVLRVQPGGGAAAIEIPLAALGDGAPATALLQVDAAWLDFGEHAVGAAAPPRQRVTLVNAGTAPWRATAIVTTGADAASFVLAGSCAVGQPLAAGARCTVDVGFKPQAPGIRQATLLLQSADGDEPALVSLAGQAVAAGLPRLQADTAWLQWAPLRPGGVAAAQVLISNQGSAPAEAPRWAIDGPFRIGRLGAGCLGTLAPGAVCTAELLFEPTSPGAASGRLAFGGPGGVALRGEAVDAAIARLVWQAAASEPSHGTAAVGGAPLASGFWTLVNTGDAATGPLVLSFAGAQAGDFSLDATSSCRAGAVLAPRQACNSRVNFHPSGVGPRSATLRLQGGPAFVDKALEGRGRADAQGLLLAHPRALWFEASAATAAAAVPASAAAAGGAPAPAGVVWQNDGPAALAVTAIGLRGDGFDQSAGGCPAPPFILQPGQQCAVGIAWNGGADARFGAELVARVDNGAPLAVPLAVVEDPALRSNVGGSGGGGFRGGFGAAWVLALALAAAGLRRAESRDD